MTAEIWKADALERMADDDRVIKDQAALIAGYYAKALTAVRAGWGEPVAAPEPVSDVATLRALIAALSAQNEALTARMARMEAWQAEQQVFSKKVVARLS